MATRCLCCWHANMRSSAPCFLCQIGSILFSLSCIRHSFQHSSLQQLAARLVADDCQRLRLCGERDIVNIVKGMQAQVRGGGARGQAAGTGAGTGIRDSIWSGGSVNTVMGVQALVCGEGARGQGSVIM